MHLIWSKIHKIVVIPPGVFQPVWITWPISLSWLAQSGHLSCEDLMKCAGGLIMKPPQLPRIISDGEECFLCSILPQHQYHTILSLVFHLLRRLQTFSKTLFYYEVLGLNKIVLYTGKIRKISKFIFLLIAASNRQKTFLMQWMFKFWTIDRMFGKYSNLNRIWFELNT